MDALGRESHRGDAWAASAQFDCAHALCNAHPLRALTCLDDVAGLEWAGAFKALLCTIKQAVEDTRAAGALPLPTSQRTAFEATYDQLLQVGLAHEAEQPPLPKISGTFRTRDGAQHFCRIRGDISTLKQQGRHVLSALSSLLSGLPVTPALDGGS